MTIEYTATYSPEDNKLRLYVSDRLSDDTYNRLKKIGFRWAPMQKLFYAHWSPYAEDICIELAEVIVAEQTTLAERAEAKAARLEALAEKRKQQALDNSREASNIANELNNQPVLMGHHSQRKIEKQKARAERLQEQAEKAADAVRYWNWKAEGAEYHANMKNDPSVRRRRIKTLFTDLRKFQQHLNHAHVCIALWNTIDNAENTEKQNALVNYYVGAYLKSGGKAAPRDHYQKFKDGEITAQQVIDDSLAMHRRTLENDFYKRHIQHLFNRIRYEWHELGGVPYHEGKITAAILKAFARELGADKPEAKKGTEGWTLDVPGALPFLIGEGKSITLTEDEWRNHMQHCGYDVPAPKPKKAPILNFKCDTLEVTAYRGTDIYRQIELTKEQYSNVHPDMRGILHSACGQFRMKYALDPFHDGPYYKKDRVMVFITDSKVHPTPESPSINKKQEEAA